jgi:hypothetical protein
MAPFDGPGSERRDADPGGASAAAPARAYPPGWSSPAPADLGEAGSTGAWALIWTIVAVKAITLVVTFAVARSWDAGAIMAIMSWPWLLAIAALVAGPLLFRLRLRRVRARRLELLRSEWEVDEEVEGR